MARQISFFWWTLTYMTCTGEEEKSLPTAPSKYRVIEQIENGVTSAAVTSAAVRIITAGALRNWLLGPIGSNVNQCSIAPQSTTAYRDGVPSAGTCEEMAESSGVLTAGGPVDNGGATFNHHLQVPFLQEDGPEDGVVAAVEPVDSDEEEAEEEDIDNRDSVIQQYFQ
ncbi:hypothetical protein NDU88_001945 [Pleurodeles waltl]|uniref:Uncharacterized protein n=1 Tax=Pleurodeles waltl TaxID=8319 RepID=A0AAV7LN05_PLEWA|nr:hypothetical protein NDU88_001945 [Pleurodeles waltl]